MSNAWQQRVKKMQPCRYKAKKKTNGGWRLVASMCLLLPGVTLNAQGQAQAITDATATTTVEMTAATEPYAESNWSAGIALGAGRRSNPLLGGDDIDLWWSLDLAWFGERWFFDNGDLGFSLRDTSSYTVSWVSRVNTERAFFSELNEGLFSGFSAPNSLAPATPPDAAESDQTLDVAVQLPDRDYALETGLEYQQDGEWGAVHVQAMADVSGTHDGYSLWASYAYDIVVGRWHIAPSVSAQWKSRQLNDYYYGIRPSEANSLLNTYSAASGVNWGVKLNASWFINEHWRVLLSADHEWISATAADSPLLSDDTITAWFAGIHYAF